MGYVKTLFEAEKWTGFEVKKKEILFCLRQARSCGAGTRPSARREIGIASTHRFLAAFANTRLQGFHVYLSVLSAVHAGLLLGEYSRCPFLSPRSCSNSLGPRHISLVTRVVDMYWEIAAHKHPLSEVNHRCSSLQQLALLHAKPHGGQTLSSSSEARHQIQNRTGSPSSVPRTPEQRWRPRALSRNC